MNWVRGHAREIVVIGPWGLMRDCVLFLQLGAGTGRGGEGRARARCALSIDVFDVDVVSGAASAYWVVGF